MRMLRNADCNALSVGWYLNATDFHLPFNMSSMKHRPPFPTMSGHPMHRALLLSDADDRACPARRLH